MFLGYFLHNIRSKISFPFTPSLPLKYLVNSLPSSRDIVQVQESGTQDDETASFAVDDNRIPSFLFCLKCFQPLVGTRRFV